VRVVVFRSLFALFFVVAGIAHFVFPDAYARIVPPLLPQPKVLVVVSGIAEIAGGIGILVSKTRRMAAFGLVILLIVVFPANIYMAVSHVPFAGLAGKSWLQWRKSRQQTSSGEIP
jgi:uncharacterized membrane protein